MDGPVESPLGGAVVLVGLMASGKSTVGRKVARLLGRRFVDADVELEARTGRSVGHPVRALKNRFTRELARLEREGADPDAVMSLGVGSLAKAVRDGDVDRGSVMAGQIAGLLKDEKTACEIVTGIMREAEEVFASLGAPGALEATEVL